MKFSIFVSLLLISSFLCAQNMGMQYVTIIVVKDSASIWTETFISENEYPGGGAFLTESLTIGEDTLKADLRKAWTDEVIFYFEDEGISISQEPTLRKFYLASFWEQPYYYVCRDVECRWLIPSHKDFSDKSYQVIRFSANIEWPAFEIELFDHGRVVLTELSLSSNGDRCKKSFVYNFPIYRRFK